MGKRNDTKRRLPAVLQVHLTPAELAEIYEFAQSVEGTATGLARSVLMQFVRGAFRQGDHVPIDLRRAVKESVRRAPTIIDPPPRKAAHEPA